jgi:hypothetical protein
MYLRLWDEFNIGGASARMSDVRAQHRMLQQHSSIGIKISHRNISSCFVKQIEYIILFCLIFVWTVEARVKLCVCDGSN